MKKDVFKGKVVWITGASSGIGEALAYEFGRAGADLILSARNSQEMERVKGNGGGDRKKVIILPLDLFELGSLAAKTKIALDFFGRIDIMVHNAGVALRDLVINTSLDVDERIMRTNYFGSVALTKALLPSMIKNSGGQFVIISSLSGKYGVPKLSAYSASKHALHGFFDSLRAELTKDKIKVTIIIPGLIKTSITENAFKGDGSINAKMESTIEKGMAPKKAAKKY